MRRPFEELRKWAAQEMRRWSTEPRRRASLIAFVLAVAPVLYLDLTYMRPHGSEVVLHVVLVLSVGYFAGLRAWDFVELASQLRNPRIARTVVLWTAGTLAFIALMWGWSLYKKTPRYQQWERERQLASDPFEASFEAEERIRARLKCPSTARISSSATRAGGNSYRVTGYADAQNSFGAMRRVRFSCTMTKGERGWTMTNFAMLDP